MTDFKRPLADAWRISQPLAVSRDGARGSLHVDAAVPGELLAAPVRWSGGALILEVDLDLARVEYRDPRAIAVVWSGLADIDRANEQEESLFLHGMAAAALGFVRDNWRRVFANKTDNSRGDRELWTLKGVTE